MSGLGPQMASHRLVSRTDSDEEATRQGEPGRALLFGKPWNSAVCEGATFIEAPTYARCLSCREQIGEDDDGYLMLTVGDVDPDFLVGVGRYQTTLTATHRECQLLETVGHQFGVCSCTGWPDLPSRDAARRLLLRVDDAGLDAIEERAGEAVALDAALRREFESRPSTIGPEPAGR